MVTDSARRRNPRSWTAATLAVAWCSVVVVGLLVLPLASSTTVTSEDATPRTAQRSLAASEGIGLVGVAAIPLAICAVGVAGVGRRRERAVLVVATALIWTWIVLTGFSIGLLYLPAGVASCFAVAGSRSSQRTCSTSVT